MLNLFRASLTAAILLASSAPSRADPVPVIHYAPAENLEHGPYMTACRSCSIIAILTPGYQKGRCRALAAGAKS
jgi:hypothetical protein